MKKLCLLAVSVIIGVTALHAQYGIDIGAKGGVNFASVDGDDTDGLDGRTSIHIGGVVNISISELFAVQPELLYSRQGFENNDANVTVFLDYLNIPLLADFTVADGLSLQGGPQIGFKLNSIVKDNDTDNEVDLEDVEGVDLGVGIGGQYNLPMGLFFQARYVVGISDVFENFNGKNNVLSLSVGYFFK